jgi:hypothetical protein
VSATVVVLVSPPPGTERFHTPVFVAPVSAPAAPEPPVFSSTSVQLPDGVIVVVSGLAITVM